MAPDAPAISHATPALRVAPCSAADLLRLEAIDTGPLVPDLEIVEEWGAITEDGSGEHYADPCAHIVRAVDVA